MCIEQCLMRSEKTQGGLINVTQNESARAKWMLSAHILTHYSDSLRSLTSISTGTLSEQHKEMQKGRRKKRQ